MNTPSAPLFCSVAVAPLAPELTYAVPDELVAKLEVGSCVTVPLGTRTAQGYVLKVSAELACTAKTRAVTGVVGNTPHFLASQLPLFEWVAKYYGYPLSQVLEVAIPRALPELFCEYATRTEKPCGEEKLGKSQREVLQYVEAQHGKQVPLTEISRIGKSARSAAKRLEELGFLLIERSEQHDAHLANDGSLSWSSDPVALTEVQGLCVGEILRKVEATSFTPYLLHGITGSGKTEVYIEAARAVLARGGGVLVIVPEIALTPQLIGRFAARLGSRLAVLHSALSPRARWDAWRALIAKRDMLAIGARSALFAPVANLQLIIVDEEHDTSFKQNDGLRYHARDLALVRGRQASCPVVLGSATPSLETYLNAAKKKYSYLSLPTRPGASVIPQIEIVDMRKIRKEQLPSPSISPQLHAALSECLSKGEQAFVLYNRRGFASYLQCSQCGFVVSCPNCSVTLTLHQATNALICHYCGFHAQPAQYCVQCEGKKKERKKKPGEEDGVVEEGRYQPRGSGTERVFDELRELFPNVPTIRFDRDTVSTADDYRTIIEKIRSEEIQLVVGTQMIAKGHDLPSVTVVGVVDCDISLNLPDFRAAERVFQLLVQVSGRAGRGSLPGRVLLQTKMPAHPAIACAQRHDYLGFVKGELTARKPLLYPPYGKMVRIVAQCFDKESPRLFLEQLAAALSVYSQEHHLSLKILGPAPATLFRIKAEYRFHLIVKAADNNGASLAVQFAQNARPKQGKLRIIVDRDPQDML